MTFGGLALWSCLGLAGDLRPEPEAIGAGESPHPTGAVSAGPGRNLTKSEARWVPSRWRLADCLTKKGLSAGFRERMDQGNTKLHELSMQAVKRSSKSLTFSGSKRKKGRSSFGTKCPSSSSAHVHSYEVASHDAYYATTHDHDDDSGGVYFPGMASNLLIGCSNPPRPPKSMSVQPLDGYAHNIWFSGLSDLSFGSSLGSGIGHSYEVARLTPSSPQVHSYEVARLVGDMPKRAPPSIRKRVKELHAEASSMPKQAPPSIRKITRSEEKEMREKAHKLLKRSKETSRYPSRYEHQEEVQPYLPAE